MPDPGLAWLMARVAIAGAAAKALGPGYEKAAEQLADRIVETIATYSGGVRDGDPDKRLEALGRAVAESCATTLGLLAAVAAGRRDE